MNNGIHQVPTQWFGIININSQKRAASLEGAISEAGFYSTLGAFLFNRWTGVGLALRWSMSRKTWIISAYDDSQLLSECERDGVKPTLLDAKKLSDKEIIKAIKGAKRKPRTYVYGYEVKIEPSGDLVIGCQLIQFSLLERIYENARKATERYERASKKANKRLKKEAKIARKAHESDPHFRP